MNQLPALAGDWQIKESVVVLSSAGPFQLCGQDPTRFGLVLSNSAASGANVAPALRDPTFTNGVLINTTFTAVQYTYRDYGAYVQQAWYGVRVSTATNIYVAEILYRPQEPGGKITGLNVIEEDEVWKGISQLAGLLSRLVQHRESLSRGGRTQGA